MKINQAVEALQQKIKEEKMYSPMPNNFFYEKIMYLNQWDNTMLDYILACTYFMGTDRMKYSAYLVEKERKANKLLGLPSKRKLQDECITRLEELGLIKVTRKYKAASLIELTFFTFWVKEMTEIGYEHVPSGVMIEDTDKSKHVSTGTQTCTQRDQDMPKHVPSGVTNIRREEYSDTSPEGSGNLFSEELQPCVEIKNLYSDGLNSNDQNSWSHNIESKEQSNYSAPRVDAMIAESKRGTPQWRIAEYLLEKRKTFINNPTHDLEKWSKDIDLAMRKDNRTEAQLKKIVDWIYTKKEGKFWRPHIQSGSGLRKKFEVMEGQRKNCISKKSNEEFLI